MVTFVNNASCMLWVELLARKSGAEVLAAFSRSIARADLESGFRILRLRSDNGGEYVNDAFRTFVEEHGISVGPTRPYSLQSNGVTKRVNRSIVEGIRLLLFQSCTAKDLWGEALMAFVFTKSRSPHAALLRRITLAVWRCKPVRLDML